MSIFNKREKHLVSCSDCGALCLDRSRNPIDINGEVCRFCFNEFIPIERRFKVVRLATHTEKYNFKQQLINYYK